MNALFLQFDFRLEAQAEVKADELSLLFGDRKSGIGGPIVGLFVFGWLSKVGVERGPD